MAAALEETPVSYEDLAAIEREFDEVETEISLSSPSFRACVGGLSDQSDYAPLPPSAIPDSPFKRMLIDLQ